MHYLTDSLVLTIENITALDLLEIQIVCNLGLQQHGDKVTTSHQELGNQIHIIISILTEGGELVGSGFAILELLVKSLQIQIGNPMEYSKIDRSAITTIILVTI